MTLRELIDTVSMAHKKTLKKFEKTSSFLYIADLSIIIVDDIPDKKLSEYFNSNKFRKDVVDVNKKIDYIITKYSDFNLEKKNFFLYITKSNTLKIEAEPLVH